MALPTLNALRASVYNRDTDTLYYELSADTASLNASITKMMSAYVLAQRYSTKSALEAVDVTIQASDLTAGGAGADLQSGDVWTLWDLFVHILCESSNNAALALARQIGQEILDDEAGSGDAVARFVTEMNTEATNLGMTNTTYTTPHGFAESVAHTITANDCRRICSASFNIALVRQVYERSVYRLTINRSGDFTLTSSAVDTVGVMGSIGVRGAKAGLSGDSHLGVLWEAPNGQEVVIALLESAQPSGKDNIEADFAAIVAQLVIDYPELATPGTAWTPATAFSGLSAGGGYWFADNNSTTFQDTGEVTAAGDGDPVGRWNPLYSGTAGAYFQASGAARPTLNNNSGTWSIDGTGTHYLNLGTSIGNTTLYAGGTERWIFLMRLKTTSTLGTVFSKTDGGGVSLRTTQYYIQAPTQPGVVFNGSAITTYQLGINDNNSNLVGAHYDGEFTCFEGKNNGGIGVDNGTTANNLTEQISLLSSASGSNTVMQGQIEAVFLIDQFDSRTLHCARDYMQGGTPNATKDPTGGVSTIPPKAHHYRQLQS